MAQAYCDGRSFYMRHSGNKFNALLRMHTKHVVPGTNRLVSFAGNNLGKDARGTRDWRKLTGRVDCRPVLELCALCSKGSSPLSPQSQCGGVGVIYL